MMHSLLHFGPEVAGGALAYCAHSLSHRVYGAVGRALRYGSGRALRGVLALRG
jgi:hypothetical protein